MENLIIMSFLALGLLLVALGLMIWQLTVRIGELNTELVRRCHLQYNLDHEAANYGLVEEGESFHWVRLKEHMDRLHELEEWSDKFGTKP